MKITVMIQYVGHVVHAGGHLNYRTAIIDLTPEQESKLKLHDDEYFGPIALEQAQREDV